MNTTSVVLIYRPWKGEAKHVLQTLRERPKKKIYEEPGIKLGKIPLPLIFVTSSVNKK